jgi:hypothetical protein
LSTQVVSLPNNVTEYLGTLPYFPNGFITGTGTSAGTNKVIIDATASTPAPLGALVTIGGTGTWAESTSLGASLPPGNYGIITVPATAVNGQATIVTSGIVNALCTTGSNAIAAGSLLIADGSGGLTTPSPSIAPSACTATAQVTGSSTVTYQLYARNAYGLDSVAITGVTTTTGPTTISAADPIIINGTVPAGTTSVVVVRSAGGASQGVIGTANVAPGQTSFNHLDYGAAATAATYTRNTATPTFGPGQVLAVSQGALNASTATETLVSVLLGGY